MVLITVSLGKGATMELARRRLGLDRDDVDEEYGLVPVDPERGLYALRVTPEAAERINPGTEYQGPWADPRIEPYGP